VERLLEKCRTRDWSNPALERRLDVVVAEEYAAGGYGALQRSSHSHHRQLLSANLSK